MEPAFKSGELYVVGSGCGSRVGQSGCSQPVLGADMPASSFVSKQGRTEWISMADRQFTIALLFSHSILPYGSMPSFAIGVRLGLRLPFTL